MDEQFDEMKNSVSQKFKDDISIIAITSDAGITEFLQKNTFGTIRFLTNDDFYKMNDNDFKKFISSFEEKNILLMGNSEKCINKISNFAENNKRITTIKSSNDSELISSIFAFSPETDLKENKINISSALEENISIFLTESDLESKDMKSKLKDLDQRFITVLGHENKPELSKKIDNYLNKKFDLEGLELITHSSSEYDFIVSVE